MHLAIVFLRLNTAILMSTTPKATMWFKQTEGHDNLRAAMQNLLYHAGAPVHPHTIQQGLAVHPGYPSLLSANECLTQWHIPNMPVQIAKEQLFEVPMPAIAHVNDGMPKFVVITELDQQGLRYIDTATGFHIATHEAFAEIWQGVTLIIDLSQPDPRQQQLYNETARQQRLKGYKTIAAIGLLAGLTGYPLGQLAAATGAFNLGWLSVLLKLLGLLVGAVLLAKDWGLNPQLAASFCPANKQGQPSGCQKVLTSASARLLPWLSWAEAGMGYFTATWLATIFTMQAGQWAGAAGLFTVLALLALPVVVYSVWQQLVVLSAVCRLCMAVQVLLLADVAVLVVGHGLPLDGLTLAAVPWLLVALAVALPLMAWWFLKPKHTVQAQAALQRRLNVFRYNKPLLQELLQQRAAVNAPAPSRQLVLGNDSAPNTVTVVLSPSCQHCRKAFTDLKGLLNQHGNEMKVAVSPTGFGDFDTWQYAVNSRFVATAITGKPLLPLLESWYTHGWLDPQAWLKKHPEDAALKAEVDQLVYEHRVWNSKGAFTNTPAYFVNEHPLPEGLTLWDAPYFMPPPEQPGQ